MRWKWKIQLDNVKHEYVVGENQHQHNTFFIDTAQDTRFNFYVERNAHLVVEILIAHADVVVDVNCILRGHAAQARITIACSLQEHQARVVTMQHHQAPHTQSRLIIKSLLYDNAVIDYYGIVRVEKDAVYSYASQENRNMLLSDSARAISIPSLEVLPHEVQCFHASATGRFDMQQLFYMASRGINQKVAQSLLSWAFFADMFVSDELKEKVRVLTRSWHE